MVATVGRYGRGDRVVRLRSCTVVVRYACPLVLLSGGRSVCLLLCEFVFWCWSTVLRVCGYRWILLFVCVVVIL